MTQDKCKPGPKACASINLPIFENRQVRTEPHKRLTYYSPTITSSAHYTLIWAPLRAFNLVMAPGLMTASADPTALLHWRSAS